MLHIPERFSADLLAGCPGALRASTSASAVSRHRAATADASTTRLSSRCRWVSSASSMTVRGPMPRRLFVRASFE